VLGVTASSSPRAIEKAFRERVRVEHPDRFPPGSEAWEDASYRMTQLTEARRLLTAPAAPPSGAPDDFVAGTTETGDRWAWAADAPKPPSEGRFLTEEQIDRRRRTWGLGWGSFLLVSAAVSYAIGAAQPVNDAVPFWSPALALTGLTALAIGARAARRLRR